NPIICTLCASAGGMLAKDSVGKLYFKPVNTSKTSNALKIIKESDKIIVLSDFMKDQLVNNKIDSNKIIKIHPFIDVDKVLSENDHDNNSILYVGQITRGKGIDLLLNSLLLVKSDYQLKLVGKGNDEEFVKNFIKENNLEDKVEFVGFTLEVEKYYSECSFVIVPSRWQEPFGLIGIEAFSKSKPVVGFDVGGISEWLKDGYNGWLIPEGNIVRMAEIIDHILNNKEELKLRSKNAYLTAKEYSRSKFIESYKALLASTGGINV
ncbi:MAG: glycosyltransferase, partial [Candidatus Delongbacteria bacterium]|nr:glycosyltransferase [Candidatus Delongbacteria bacterium]